MNENWKALKQQADSWYNGYELTHRTQQAMERAKYFNEIFGTIVEK